MKRLLIINPNTTAMVTDRVTAAARASLPGVDLLSATGRFGAAYISSRASFAVAGHAALDALAEWGTGVDAVLLACFGDPGLDALREVSQVPVIGLVEAACVEAGEGGRPFSIVTGGERWGPMLREMIMLRGLDASLAGITTVAPTGGQIAEDPEGAIGLLADTCRDCVEHDGAGAVILGGAGLIGLAAKVAPLLDVPVICSVEAGFRAAARAIEAPRDPAACTLSTPSVGLSRPLTRLFQTGRLEG